MQIQLIAEMREVGDQIKGFDDELREVEAQLGTVTAFYS